MLPFRSLKQTMNRVISVRVGMCIADTHVSNISISLETFLKNGVPQHSRQHVSRPSPLLIFLQNYISMETCPLATPSLRQPQTAACQPHSQQNICRPSPLLSTAQYCISMETCPSATPSLRPPLTAACQPHSHQYVCRRSPLLSIVQYYISAETCPLATPSLRQPRTGVAITAQNKGFHCLFLGSQMGWPFRIGKSSK
jgi:hypothetical protein